MNTIRDRVTRFVDIERELLSREAMDVRQAALEKQQILISNVPADYVKVTSGLGEHTPRFICVTPILYEDRVKGVVEIGTLTSEKGSRAGQEGHRAKGRGARLGQQIQIRISVQYVPRTKAVSGSFSVARPHRSICPPAA